MLILIIYLSLCIITSQNLRKIEEQNLLSFCFQVNSSPKDDNDIEIFCSGNKCYGILGGNIIKNKFFNDNPL